MTAVNNKQITGVIVKKFLKTFYFCPNLGYGDRNLTLVLNHLPQRRSSAMKQRAIYFRALFIVLLAAAALPADPARQTAAKSSLPGGAALAAAKLIIIGHRGGAGLSPENTLSAFEKACELKVDAVELDVHLSADDKIVVHHDYTLQPEIARTPDGKWLDPPGPALKELTLAQLKTYDVGRLKPDSRYARRYPDQEPVDGERIPTLAEVISLLKTKCPESILLWIEIKTDPERPDLSSSPQTIVRKVTTLLGGTDFSARACILSFDWRALAQVQKISPEIPTVYLTNAGVRLNNIKPGQPGPSPWMAGLDIDAFGGSIPRAVKAAGGRYWAPYYTYLTAALLEEAHQLGLKVYVWTVDSRRDMVRLMEMGVDGIITNRPDILKAVMGLR
jgi:glycerophosphoryl diester phosphodiesterase